MKDVLLKSKEFATFKCTERDPSLPTLCQELLNAQKTSWKQLHDNYASLERSDYRTLTMNGFSSRIQFNPGRIINTAAKVDPKSIAKRKCFLCLENLPAPQQGILYREEYLILCNPWPIFPRHFTIAHLKHLPQAIENSFPFLLWAAKDFGTDFIIFYNGPKCGASAPDHLHFQAAPARSMPIKRDVTIHKHMQKINEIRGVSLYRTINSGRSIIIVAGKEITDVQETFSHVLQAIQHVLAEQSEPMINIICSYKGDYWMVMIF